MEAIEVDEIPANEEPVQVTDQIFVQDEGARVLEPEMQESQQTQQQPVRSEFDVTKLSYDLQQGYRVYTELMGDSIRNVTWPFLDPVDADSLGLWDYYDRIKQPMCFSTIGSKFVDSKYTSITEVIADIRLILENCYRYNGPNHWVSKLGQKLEKILEQKLALLNRSLRDKVTLAATMTINKGLPMDDLEASGRRRSSRQNYLSMVNGENSSSLVNHLKIIEESEEKERRRQREKEKKEANQALLQDLVKWEEKELTLETLNQLHSMWEIPSVGSLLYMVRDILGIEDINLTEFELSFVYPNKSSLLGRIFTALLITPHQRKSIYKRPAMKFKMWESKLKEKLDVWYKLTDKDGLYGASLHYGIDVKFFDIIGAAKNPLEEKSYLDLTLHQRVWILKTLCDVCFHKDYDIREKVNSCDVIEQRELFLGYDGDEHSFIYFPIFQTTDLRVYIHDPLKVPTLKAKPKKEPSPPPPTLPPEKKKAKKTPSRSCTPSRGPRSARLRQLRSDTVEDDKEEEQMPESSENGPKTPSPDAIQDEPQPLPCPAVQDDAKPPPPPPCPAVQDDTKPVPSPCPALQDDVKPPSPPPCPALQDDAKTPSPAPCLALQDDAKPPSPPPIFQSEDGFHLACHDIETLKSLAEQFEEPPPPPPPKKRGRRFRLPLPRKHCVVDLHETFMALLEEMEKYEGAFSRNYIKAKLKIMKESLEPELVDEPEVEPEPECTEEWGSELSDDDAGAKLDAKDEDYRIEDEYRNADNSTKKAEVEQHIGGSNEGSSIAIQTSLPVNKRKRKLSKGDDASSNGTSCSIALQTSAPKIKKKPRKWSPTKEKVFPPTSGPSAVLISAVSAEESLKATTALLKGVATSQRPCTSGCAASPDKILLTVLGQALKRAQENASAVQSANVQGMTDTHLNSGETTASPQKTTTNSLVVSTTPTKSQRKRILVSPEGKSHEIKPSFHIVSTQGSLMTPTMSTSLPSHPPIQRKSDFLTVASTKGGTVTVTLGPHGIRTTPTTIVGTMGASTTTHQKPNILSRGKKQPTVSSKTVALPNKVNACQAATIVSGNHNYALPANQASKIVGPTKITGNIKMVQIIPNVTPTNKATMNSLYGVAAKGTTPTPNPSPALKMVSTQPGVAKVVASNSLTGVVKVLPKGQTSPLKTPTSSTKSIAIPKTATSLKFKTQGTQPVTSQTKIIFIPAASVDAKSPLASFKPQTITTTNGQSIYGYAVVVPPGSSEEINAVINSSLKKTSLSTASTKQGTNVVQGKPTVTTLQGKPIVTTLQGKPMTTVLQGKTTSTGILGKPLATGLQGKPITTGLLGKPITTGLQGKPITTGLQGKPVTTVLQGKPTAIVLQGKPTSTGIQGKPITTGLQGKPITTVLQGKPTITTLQGKAATVGPQGKPIVTVLQGKPTYSKVATGNSTGNLTHAVIRGSNIATVLSTLGQLRPGTVTTTIARPVVAASKTVVTTAVSSNVASTLQPRPVATTIATTIQPSSGSLMSTTSIRHPVSSTLIGSLKPQPGILTYTTAIVGSTTQPHNVATLVDGTIKLHPSPVTSTTSAVASMIQPRLSVASAAPSTLANTIQPSPCAAATASVVTNPIHTGKVTLLQIARTRILAATTANANQPPCSAALTVPSSVTSPTQHHPGVTSSVISKVISPTQSRPDITATTISNIVRTTQPRSSVSCNLNSSTQPAPGSTTKATSSSASTIQSHSDVITIVTSNVTNTNQPHSGVVKTVTSNVTGTNQPHSGIVKTVASNVTSTNQPHSGVLKTVTNITSTNQPHSGAITTVSSNVTSTNQPQPQPNSNITGPIRPCSTATTSVASNVSCTNLLHSDVTPNKDTICKNSSSKPNVLSATMTTNEQTKDLEPSTTQTDNSKDTAMSTVLREESETKCSSSVVVPPTSTKEKLSSPTKLIAQPDNQTFVAYYNGVCVHSTLRDIDSVKCIKTNADSRDTCQMINVVSMDACVTTDTTNTISKDTCGVTTTNGIIHCVQDSEEAQPSLSNASQSSTVSST